MATYLSQQVLAVTPGGTASFTATCPTAIPGEPITASSGDVNVCTIQGIGAAPGPVTFTVTALPQAIGWTLITVNVATDTADSGTTLIVTVAPAVANIPGGYTTTTAIQQVRDRCDEPNLPAAATLLGFLNAGLEEVSNRLGGIVLARSFPLSNGQLVQALTSDVQDVLSCSYSTGTVQSQGALVYPMFQRDQGSFMDFAAGFPAQSLGPPAEWWTFQDASNTQIIQIYPSAQPGLLNLYYRARPTQWSLSTPNAGTNLDTSAQECVILWACARTLENRGRSGEAKDIFTPQYREAVADTKADIKRRTAPKFGTVRDVASLAYPSSPFWLRG